MKISYFVAPFSKRFESSLSSSIIPDWKHFRKNLKFFILVFLVPDQFLHE